jgi:murein DD-endopeptidase MepM/ murein hydrolase activator NlpD
MFPIKVKDMGRYRRFMWTSDNVWFHLGHDFDVPENTDIFAIDDGEIIFSGQMEGFGGTNPSRKGGCVIIQHHGYICIYGHLKDLPGIKKVKAGDYIGKVDHYYIGKEDYPHLHFGKHLGNGIPQTFLGYEKKQNLTGWVDPLKDL